MGRAEGERFTCVCGERCTMVPHWRSGVLAPITDRRLPEGNVLVVEQAGRPVYEIVPKGERHLHAGLHLNHFSNCAERAQFGRRR